MSPTDDRERLYDLMEARRLELRLTLEQVAKNGGISYEALRAFRAGQPTIRRLTARGIEAGLQWAPGSIDAVLKGGDPKPEPSTSPDAASPGALFDDLIRRIWDAEDVSDDRKREIVREVRQAQAQIQAIADEVDKGRRIA